MLRIKKQCEKCGTPTGLTDVAYICSFECTFCEACTRAMNAVCPNCQGHLVVRPIRTRTPAGVATSLVSKKLFGQGP